MSWVDVVELLGEDWGRRFAAFRQFAFFAAWMISPALVVSGLVWFAHAKAAELDHYLVPRVGVTHTPAVRHDAGRSRGTQAPSHRYLVSMSHG